MGKDDIMNRFFHEKRRFLRHEIEVRTQIDYIKDLSIVAVVGEFGFGKINGVGEYFLIPQKNIAEIDFIVSKAYQGKGLGKMLLHKLLKAARENGIAGLVALTYPQNKRMIQLFRSLPYKSHTAPEDDLISKNYKAALWFTAVMERGEYIVMCFPISAKCRILLSLSSKSKTETSGLSVAEIKSLERIHSVTQTLAPPSQQELP